MKAIRLLPVLLAALAACAHSGGPASAPGDVSVELDAFSGRPNPVWTLTPEQASELAARLRYLPSAGEHGATAPGLGYRGFRIRNPGGDGGVPAEVYVRGGGAVIIGGDAEGRVWLRDTRGVEAWLIGQARARGWRDVF